MRMTAKKVTTMPRRLALQTAALLALALPAAAQFLGYTSPQTIRTVALNAVTAATISTPVPIIGQSAHYVAYTIGGTGSVSQVVLRLIASQDGTNYFAIGEDATATTLSGSLFASGYYPFIEVQLVTFTVVSGIPTLTATYTGTSVSPAAPWGDNAGAVYSKKLVVGRAANGSFANTLHMPFSLTAGGLLYITFSAATCAGSSFTISTSAESLGTVTIVPATTLTATTNTQVFFVPSFGAFSLTFNYTSGCGASAATLTAELELSNVMQVIAGSNGAQPPVITPVTVTTGGALTVSLAGNSDTAALITCAGCIATQTGTDQTNAGQRGLKVVVDMTVVGTGSITCAIQGKDVASGKYYSLLTGAAIITNSTNVYTVYPGITATTNSTADILPRTWRVVCTANNANATTYTVGASVIN